MNSRSFHFTFLVLAGVAACGAAVATYPAPDGIRPASDFQVTVNGKGVFVYDSAVAPFAHFSFAGRAKVTVTLRPDVNFGEEPKYTAWGQTIRSQPFRAPIRELGSGPAVSV